MKPINKYNFILQYSIPRKFYFLGIVLFLSGDAISQNTFLAKYHIADSFFKNNQYDTAMTCLNDALNYKMTDSFRAEILNRIGIIFKSRNDDSSAMLNYKNALTIWEKEKNETKKARLYYNMGQVFSNKNDAVQAIFYFNSSLASCRLAKDSLNNYLSLCHLYQKTKKLDESFDILVTHILHFKENITNNQSYLISSYFYFYYYAKEKNDSALFYAKKSILEASDPNFLVAGYSNVADAYLNLKKYNKAKIYLDSTLLLNKKINDKATQLNTYDTYAKVDFYIGDFKNAYKYSILARNLSDTLFNLKENAALQDIGIKYQTDKKQKDNEILQKDISLKNRNILFSLMGLGLVSLLGGISFRNYKLKQKANVLLSNQKEQVQKLADDLNIANQTKTRLFSTISHDLRGPVSSLYASLKMQELNFGKNIEPNTVMSEQTVQLLDTLEDLLVWSKSQMDRFVPMSIPINAHELMEEMKDFYFTSAYIKQINLINITPTDIQFRSDENIIRTMLRNAIANAISHTQNNGSIILSTQKMNAETIRLSVSNQCTNEDYLLFSNAFQNTLVQSGSRGLGLVLIKEFADKINAKISLAHQNNQVILRIDIS